MVLQRAHVEMLVCLGEVDTEHLRIPALAAEHRLDLRPREVPSEGDHQAAQRSFPPAGGVLGAEVPHPAPIFLDRHEGDVGALANHDLDTGAGEAGQGEVLGVVAVDEHDRGALVDHDQAVGEDPHAALGQGSGGLEGDRHVQAPGDVEEGAAGEECVVQRREDVLAGVGLAEKVTLDEVRPDLDGVVERQEHDPPFLERRVAVEVEAHVLRAGFGRCELVEVEAEAPQVGVAPGLVLLPRQLELLDVAPSLEPSLQEPRRLVERAAEGLDVVVVESHRIAPADGFPSSRRSPPSAAGSAG